MAKVVPDCLPINTIKCLFKVNEAHAERRRPFSSLLHHNSEGYDLVGAGALFPESSLLISEFLVDGFLHPLRIDAGKDFAGDGQQSDSSHLALCQVSVFGELH